MGSAQPNPTRNGNSSFVRCCFFSMGEISEGMGQILGKCSLRLAAIRAGVRELSGWSYQLLTTTPEAKSSSCPLNPRNCYFSFVDRYPHAKRRRRDKKTTHSLSVPQPTCCNQAEDQAVILLRVENDRVIDYALMACIRVSWHPADNGGKLQLFDVCGSIHPPGVMTSVRLL